MLQISQAVIRFFTALVVHLLAIWTHPHKGLHHQSMCQQGKGATIFSETVMSVPRGLAPALKNVPHVPGAPHFIAANTLNTPLI